MKQEHIDLIWFGKKFTCEENCECHTECKIADDYVKNLKHEINSGYIQKYLCNCHDRAVKLFLKNWCADCNSKIFVYEVKNEFK
jgi:hypothetical protein